MALPSLLLPILLGVLAIDTLIEVGFLGSMVGYLHQAHGDVPFQIAATSTTPQFGLYPKPAHLLVNQGHTSNGAAGTALILVSLLGFLVLYIERRDRKRSDIDYIHVSSTNDGQGNTHTRKSRYSPHSFAWLYPTWIVFTVLSFLLTLSALIYVFVVTHQTDVSHSHIDLSVAASTFASRQGVVFKYPDDTWTPENWYNAVLKLAFVDNNEKGDIRTHVRLMEAWRWNLIPMFLLGLAIMVIALAGYIGRRKGGGNKTGKSMVQQKHLSTVSEL